MDREKCRVYGVKILGLESRNGRTYLREAVGKAKSLYEGKPCNIDHPEKSTAMRSYRDRFGVFENVDERSDGLWADIAYNPKHVCAEQFLYDAEHNPAACGFSPVHECRLREANGRTEVYEITAVRSVDLVADAATTNSIFEGAGILTRKKLSAILVESALNEAAKEALRGAVINKHLLAEMEMEPPADSASPEEALKAGFKSACLAALDDDGLDMKAKLAKLKELLTAQEKLIGGGAEPTAEEGEGEGEDEDDPEEVKPEGVKPKASANLVSENQRLKRELLARRLLAEAKAEAKDTLVEALTGLGTEAKMKTFIAENCKAGATKRPTASGPGNYGGSQTVQESRFKDAAEMAAFLNG